MAADEILFNRKIVFVYSIPEESLSKNAGMFRASDWDINNPDWKGEMTVSGGGAGICRLQFGDSTGTPYGRTFIHKYPTALLQAVRDSSRYFVIQLKKFANNSGRVKAGLGFYTKEDSKAFVSSIQEYFNRRLVLKRSASPKINYQPNEKRPRLPEISSQNPQIGRKSFEIPSKYPCDSRMDPGGKRFSRFAMSLSPSETEKAIVKAPGLPSQSEVPGLSAVDPAVSFKRICNARDLKCASKSCSMNFKFEFQRHRHESEIHGCVCPCCQSVFNKRMKLFKHIELVHKQAVQDKIVAVKCQECGEKFLTHIEYKIHLPLHEHSNKLTCPFCDSWNFSFYDKLSKNEGLEQYDFHLKQVHVGLFSPANLSQPSSSVEHNHNLARGTLKCGLCSESFYYEFQRRHHVRAQHEGDVRCPRCPFLTTNRHKLYGHILQIHRREVQDRVLDVGCSDCSERFLTKKEYNIHLPVHQTAMLTCPFCTQWMFQAIDMTTKKWGLQQYDQHLSRNHPQVFESEKFIWKPDLSATQSRAKVRSKKKKKKQPNGNNTQLYIPKLTMAFNWREFLQPEVVPVPNSRIKKEVNVPVVPPTKPKPTAASGQQVLAGIKMEIPDNPGRNTMVEHEYKVVPRYESNPFE